MSYIDLTRFSLGRLNRKSGSLIAKDLPKDGNRVWKVTAGPNIEPVSLSELKTFSRIDGTSEDFLLESFIQAARGCAEEYLGRALIQQTIQMQMDYWSGDVVELPRPPLISVEKIATLDEDDTETEYDSDNYYVIMLSEPGRVVLKQSVSAPYNSARDRGGYLIEYKAGYGTDGDDVPEGIRAGIKLWAATIYATRVIDSKNPPPEAKIAFDIYRTMSVMVR